MTAQAIPNPLPSFTELDGLPLQGGYVYFGLSSQDPRQYPKAVYWDEALASVATQPLRTIAGYIAHNGGPANVWVEGNCSVLVLDSQQRQVYYMAEWKSTANAAAEAAAEAAAAAAEPYVELAQEWATKTDDEVEPGEGYGAKKYAEDAAAYLAAAAAFGYPALHPSDLFNGDNGAAYSVRQWNTLFQDTAGTTPVTAVGQTVKRINDISGNGLHMTNSTGWVLAQDSRGWNYLAMDGATCFKSTIAWAGTALTIAVAENEETTPAADEYIVGLGTTVNSTDFGGMVMRNTEGVARFVAAGGLGSISLDAPSQGVPGDPHVCIAQTTGPTVYRDLLSATGAGSLTSLAVLNTLTLGARTRSIGDGSFCSGRFYGAVVIARNITTAERVRLSSWLRSLYGNVGSIAGIGDSHTFNTSFGLVEADFHPRKLETLLRAAGLSYQSINQGVSGNTTANMVARMTQTTRSGPHAVAVIYGSSNDTEGNTTVQAAPAPTTTTFNIGAGKGIRYGAGAMIKVNGVSCEVLSVATDQITLTAPLASAPTAGQAVIIDTEENLVKIGEALILAGTTRLLVPGRHYYNFGSGLGDTTTTPMASAAPLRAVQQSAATRLGAVYVDLYAYMRDLILAGEYAQGDDTAWHVAVSDGHLNATGEQILADAFFAAMQAEGWVL